MFTRRSAVKLVGLSPLAAHEAIQRPKAQSADPLPPGFDPTAREVNAYVYDAIAFA